MRVLVIGTYRDTDLVAHPPPLRGARRAEPRGASSASPCAASRKRGRRAYIARCAAEPPAGLVSRIYEETEGNPFFLAEVVNLMAEEGTLRRDSV